MEELWHDLQQKHRAGIAQKDEERLYSKWGKALKLLSLVPFYQSLRTHEIPPLTARYGLRVWQSYLENQKSGAMRIFWVYGLLSRK